MHLNKEVVIMLPADIIACCQQFVYLVRFSCDMGNLKCKSKSHSLLCDSVIISIFGGGGAMQGKQQVKSNGKCLLQNNL